MAKKDKKTNTLYSPALKKANKGLYDMVVGIANRTINDVVDNIYYGHYPTDEKCNRKVDCFTGCTPIYLGDKNKEKNLEQIRAAIEEVFMAGREFGFFEAKAMTELETDKQKQ